MQIYIRCKRMRTISGLRRPNDVIGCNHKVGWLHIVVYDALEVNKLQRKHKLPNQGSNHTLSERFHLIRLQGAMNEDDKTRYFFTENCFHINFSL